MEYTLCKAGISGFIGVPRCLDGTIWAWHSLGCIVKWHKTEMSKYAKYLKDVVNNKVKLQDIETVAFTEKYNFVVMKKMPKKLKDPGSFTLLIEISDSKVVHTLSDLGTSINLMPMSVFENLSLESKPSRTSLDYLIELPKPPPKSDGMMIDELEKVVAEKDVDLEISLLRG
ncbi:uncharacterized protein LOC124898497 [Capsicum annuum]|uniref:uncharacterized protein LOC124898497 n=1 Tax=Capsicum annuum TaxID=4072 RepID=UPI001FB14D26|nr:uncharacterized protein LOC124898497 [Capsicum annuum]